MPEAIQVVHIKTSLTSTKFRNTEHVLFRIDYIEGERFIYYTGLGKYYYQNRSWQTYDYKSALVGAIEDTGIFTDEFKQKIAETTSLSQVAYLFTDTMANCIVYIDDALYTRKEHKNA
jgi:hypothetical protein